MPLFQTKPTQVKRYHALHDPIKNVYHIKDADDDASVIQVVPAEEFLETHELAKEKAVTRAVSKSAGTGPKRTRRTKAQIEADKAAGNAKAPTNGSTPAEESSPANT